MSTKTYKLKHPIELKNSEGEVVSTITDLTLNRLKGKQARTITATSGIPLTLEMVAASAGLSRIEADKLDFEDIIGAAEVAVDFFGAGIAARLMQETKAQ